MHQSVSNQPLFLQDAAQISAGIRSGFVQTLNELSGTSGPTPRLDVSGIHPSLRSRLTRALQTESDPAFLYRLPGPDGLRRILTALKKAGGDPKSLASCRESIEAYEQFLAREGVNRDTLRVMLGGYLPETHSDLVRDSCRASFSAISNLQGHWAEVGVICLIITPGTDPNRCDLIVVRGYDRWRRLREDMWDMVLGHYVDESAESFLGAQFSIDGVPLNQLKKPPLLENFCSHPLPGFTTSNVGHWHRHTLAGSEIGVRSLSTFFLCEVIPNAELRYASEKESMVMEGVTLAVPTKHIVFDVLIHQDIWPHTAPLVECYNGVPFGFVNNDNHAQRQNDRIDLGITAQFLGDGLRNIECSGLGNYRQLITHVMGKKELSPAQFRGFRCEMPYPLFGSHITMRFKIPPPPNPA